MPAEVFGRTNKAFPLTWLRLAVPSNHEDIDPMVEAALASGFPLDVSSFPALWGGKLRGTEAVLCCSSAIDYERATEQTHAIDLVQAHFIETLSCIGREYWDFYFLRFRRNVPEFALAGAMEALEMARQEGHIRHVGLHASTDTMATLSMWRLHDAFEAVLIEEADPDPFVAMARERRVGIISPLEIPGAARLVTVRTAAEVMACV